MSGAHFDEDLIIILRCTDTTTSFQLIHFPAIIVTQIATTLYVALILYQPLNEQNKSIRTSSLSSATKMRPVVFYRVSSVSRMCLVGMRSVEKTAKYLLAAERLYRNHLSYDGVATATTVNLKSLVDSIITDPDIMAFQCANNYLKNYRVVGVLPSINAQKWVLKAGFFVVKLLEKGVCTPKSRVLLPTNVPHMVQLHHFFETEIYIILLIEYVECGTLWGFLARYFNESEKRFLLSLAEEDKSMIDDVERSSGPDISRTRSALYGCYKGRRLCFSVGVDFERVAEMRDETQSNDVPSTSAVVCTMGEDATGVCKVPEGDFYLVGDEAKDNVSLRSEESPTRVKLSSRHDEISVNESYKRNLSASISCVRTYLRRERRRAWPECRRLPEHLIVHWMAQLISWLYVMHNEHDEVIGDLRPDNLLIDMDGNLLMSYYCKWHNTGRPKEIVEGYSAPECFDYGWIPRVENDLWTFASILFELLSGRSLLNAAPHGVTTNRELPFPDDAEISFAARDLVSQLLTGITQRPSLESVRAHPFFRSIDWSLYDNPHTSALSRESASMASYSASGRSTNEDFGENCTGLPPYVPDLLDLIVDEECG
ncbi:hypothetical protein KIN20_020851 [Parelaphostrongylus tenuis]|uniref:Protein kinase domain-containing protein n=1 Tax=Parelaphostrongylus tenuis TaxID=148309 RepID=A0AAD5QVT4_PARTN|nr:hypothetical protein KIN20_020851 [Parelaphostrongylus tenuis]